MRPFEEWYLYLPDWLIDALGLPWYAIWAPVIVFGPILLGIWALFRRETPAMRRVPWLVVVLVIFLLLYGDVVVNSWRFNRMCRTDAGVHVYRTVEAEGYIGGRSEDIETYGFRFIEEFEQGQRGDRVRHWEKHDGKYVETLLDAPEGRYWYHAREPWHSIVPPRIDRAEYVVEDLKTGDVLGQYVNYRINPGWLDSMSINLMTLDFPVWFCTGTNGKEIRAYSPLMRRAVIKPRRDAKAEVAP